MNTKIVIAATVAALSLATTAFAGEGNDNQASLAPASYAISASSPARDTGSAQYQASNQAQYNVGFDNTVLPAYGSEGAVQTANSLPRGFENGTAAIVTAQSVNRWYAQQADHHFAAAQAATGRHG